LGRLETGDAEKGGRRCEEGISALPCRGAIRSTPERKIDAEQNNKKTFKPGRGNLIPIKLIKDQPRVKINGTP